MRSNDVHLARRLQRSDHRRVPRQPRARRRHVRGRAIAAAPPHRREVRQGRVNPLGYLSDDGRYVIFASKGGAPTNPDWYHNLKAHPDVSIEVGTDTIDVVATEATGDERDRLFSAQAERIPQFAEYQKGTDRLIPVIVLTPR